MPSSPNAPAPSTVTPFRVRWLGSVRYRDALALQRGLFANAKDNYLLLLEHPHVYTLGVRADPANVLVAPETIGAELVTADRGGDVTYHGPGQLVGYPIMSVPTKRGGGMADTAAYVGSVQAALVDALRELGLDNVGVLSEYPGVWVEPESPHARKIAAIGVRLTRGRSMHGFALNVQPDMAYFDHIVPCGIAGKAVTSLAREGVDVTMREVVDVVARHAAARWRAGGPVQRSDVAWRVQPDDMAAFTRGAGAGTPVRLTSRLREAGVADGLTIASRKPEWLRVKADFGDNFRRLKSTMRSRSLITVCEEAGCPNIFDCWNDGTATFMINGERCTRACGFCLVDTSKPEPLDAHEPARVADAVREMGLSYAVVTAVARDDLRDGGAQGFVDTIAAVRAAGVKIEVLISDCKGDPAALDAIFAARPDVLNHNVETVARLQRAVRPSAGYARSLGVLARAKSHGLVTKSSIIVGMGETFDEVVETLADLRAVGCDIVTIGQYLRPTTNHLPIARYVEPHEFDEWKRIGEQEFGIAHVESSPLTRSSYHARVASEHVR